MRLDADLGTDKHDVIRALARVVADAGRTTDADQLAADAITREGTAATGLPGGIAIPHCRTTGVEVPTLAFARLGPTVDFGAKDGPADLAFLIAAPAGGDATHLQLLTKLARALVKTDFTDSLRAASTPEEVVTLVQDVVGDAPATAPAPAPRRPATGRRSLVAVTACPTGIAHTYMAAEALEAAAAQGRRTDRRRDPGLGRLHAALPARRSRPRRGHLRRRRGRPRPRPVRRQAGRLLRREAPDRGRRRDDRRGAAATPTTPNAPRVEGARRRVEPARAAARTRRGVAAPAAC